MKLIAFSHHRNHHITHRSASAEHLENGVRASDTSISVDYTHTHTHTRKQGTHAHLVNTRTSLQRTWCGIISANMRSKKRGPGHVLAFHKKSSGVWCFSTLMSSVIQRYKYTHTHTHTPIRTNDTLWGKCIVGKIRAS